MPRFDLDSLDNRSEEAMRRFVRWMDRLLVPWFDYRLAGSERIPEGPALYVGNHSSGLMPMDAFLFGAAVYHWRGFDHVPWGLAHEVALAFPLFNDIAVPLGAIRASHQNANRLFQAGYKVLVFPGGDLDAMRPHRRRYQVELAGRRGFVRLALRAGVPLVPVVTAGAHSSMVILSDGRGLARWLGVKRFFRTEALPVAVSIPWGITIGPVLPHLPLPTRIRAEVLDPVVPERTGHDAAADDDYVEHVAVLVRERMQVAMNRLSGEAGLRARLGLR